MEQSGVKLTNQLKDALAEIARYHGQNRIYWWRVASMAKLAALGYVETYTPPSLIGRRMKARPYRITPAGIAALSLENDDGR